MSIIHIKIAYLKLFMDIALLSKLQFDYNYLSCVTNFIKLIKYKYLFLSFFSHDVFSLNKF